MDAVAGVVVIRAAFFEAVAGSVFVAFEVFTAFEARAVEVTAIAARFIAVLEPMDELAFIEFGAVVAAFRFYFLVDARSDLNSCQRSDAVVCADYVAEVFSEGLLSFHFIALHRYLQSYRCPSPAL